MTNFKHDREDDEGEDTPNKKTKEMNDEKVKYIAEETEYMEEPPAPNPTIKQDPKEVVELGKKETPILIDD